MWKRWRVTAALYDDDDDVVVKRSQPLGLTHTRVAGPSSQEEPTRTYQRTAAAAETHLNQHTCIMDGNTLPSFPSELQQQRLDYKNILPKVLKLSKVTALLLPGRYGYRWYTDTVIILDGKAKRKLR